MTASEQIDRLISGLADWRGTMFANIRRIIREADPEVVEEWKWMGTPTWSHDGILCVANALKNKVKITFYEGAVLPDPDGLFNNGLDGKQWRSIDLFQDDKISEKALKALIRAAVDHRGAKPKPVQATASRARKKSKK